MRTNGSTSGSGASPRNPRRDVQPRHIDAMRIRMRICMRRTLSFFELLAIECLRLHVTFFLLQLVSRGTGIIWSVPMIMMHRLDVTFKATAAATTASVALCMRRNANRMHIRGRGRTRAGTGRDTCTGTTGTCTSAGCGRGRTNTVHLLADGLKCVTCHAAWGDVHAGAGASTGAENGSGRK